MDCEIWPDCWAYPDGADKLGSTAYLDLGGMVMGKQDRYMYRVQLFQDTIVGGRVS